MPVAVVFAINLLLIAAIVGLVHWLGRGTQKAQLASHEAAEALFRTEFPAARIAETALTGNGALLALEGGNAIGLITALGVHWLVRMVEPQNFGSARVAGGSKIALRLKDFTAPRVTLDLGTAQQAGVWCERFEALRGRRPAPARLTAVQA